MAKEAYEKVDLLLSDGTEVILKPLNIARLKRFMTAFDELKDVDLEKDKFGNFDILVGCTGIVLEEELSEQFEETKADSKKKEKVISKEYRDYLENVLDMDTIFLCIEIGSGIKLNDPNLLRAAAEAAGTN